TRATTMTDDEDDPPFARIVDTAEDLAQLIREKPAFWQWAAFGSVLVQRKADLQREIHKHRIGYALPSGKRINDFNELCALVDDTLTEVERRTHALDRYLRSPAFTSVLGTGDT